jgi:hypothetical protein
MKLFKNFSNKQKIIDQILLYLRAKIPQNEMHLWTCEFSQTITDLYGQLFLLVAKIFGQFHVI